MYNATFQQWNMKNRRIFVRADLNVSFTHEKMVDDFRLRSILPTIDYIFKHHGSVVLATHIGRPQNKDAELSTRKLLPWFEQRGYSIIFVENPTIAASLPIVAQQIILLENLRFFSGEKTGDPFFAQQLANTATYYINDAFGVIHRNDCSISLLPYKFPENRRSIGFLIEKELRALNILKENPPRPFIAIIGGGKIEDKIPLIQTLLTKVDSLLLCPAICFSFLKALGKPIGQSLIHDTCIALCKKIILEADNHNVSYHFPSDYQIAYDGIDGDLDIIAASSFPDNAIGISIGPQTVVQFSHEINHAKTVFLNCAMGFAQRPETEESSRKIIEAMAHSSAHTVIAGGDSVAIALSTPDSALIDHLSTGGGAALAYLSDALLPGLLAFEEQ